MNHVKSQSFQSLLQDFSLEPVDTCTSPAAVIQFTISNTLADDQGYCFPGCHQADKSGKLFEMVEDICYAFADRIDAAGKKARDLRNWLTIYSYWNQGGLENVTSMLLYLVDNYSRPTGIAPSALLETPDTGKAKIEQTLTHLTHAPQPHLLLVCGDQSIS